MKVLLLLTGLLALSTLLPIASAAVWIWLYGYCRSSRSCDAAIVLGASVWGNSPSPVFRERLNEGVRLLKESRVQFIILTGGRADRWGKPESHIARDYVASQGVSQASLLVEEESRTTYENFVFAKKVMDENGLRTALVVTDPLHSFRSMWMARKVGLQADPFPTRTSRFISLRKKLPFLLKELKSLMWFLYLGH